jgi:DNA-binding MurR/RpiR family transcriptional regulator
MSCLVKMRAVRDELSGNEKKIADFIIDNAALIRDYSSQNLAASVGVSQSSIIKFSQKLNYRGFTDLKLAIHESVVKSENGELFYHQTPSVEEILDSLPQQLCKLKNDALLTTLELNDENRILSVVEVL